MKSKQTLEKLLREPLVPLFNHGDPEVCRQVMQHCYDTGIRVFEFPDRLPGALEVFRELKKFAATLDGMLLGAGTIKTGRNAELYIAAGADFLISPSIPAEVGKVCSLNDVLWIPGCATPTEINIAENMDIELVKIFPAAQLGGPAFIKAMSGPFPSMKFMASGGVTVREDELRAFFAAGVSCVAITSDLFKKELLEEQGHLRMREQLRKTFSFLRGLVK